jgi:hypothetical protein
MREEREKRLYISQSQTPTLILASQNKIKSISTIGWILSSQNIKINPRKLVENQNKPIATDSLPAPGIVD